MSPEALRTLTNSLTLTVGSMSGRVPPSDPCDDARDFVVRRMEALQLLATSLCPPHLACFLIWSDLVLHGLPAGEKNAARGKRSEALCELYLKLFCVVLFSGCTFNLTVFLSSARSTILVQTQISLFYWMHYDEMFHRHYSFIL